MYEDFVNFVRTLYHTEDFIPLHEPRFAGNEKKYVTEAIDSTFVSSVGAYVDRFEQEFASYTGAKAAVAVMNGTAALHLALMASGVEAGHEVITQPLTFVATCNAISYCGASPVFLDVDEDSMGLNPQSLKNFLEKQCKTVSGKTVNKATGAQVSAVIPMHTFGHPCRIGEIRALCDQYSLKLIEDCAESLGSFSNGTHTGLLGDIAAFSFNGNKIMTTGGGGMLITEDLETATRLKHLSTTAKQPHRWEFNHDLIGYNYRLPNLNAALGCAQLESLPAFLAAKKKIAEAYEGFCQSSSLKFITARKGTAPNFWLNAIAVKDRAEREKFLTLTNDQGIMTRPIWTLMYRLPMYKNTYRESCPVAEKLADTVVNIPSSVPLHKDKA